MCLMKENMLSKSGDKKRENHSSIKIRIPKLSRKIVKSAKVNLNRYWRAFHDLISPESYTKPVYNNQIMDHEIIEKNQLRNNEIVYPVDNVPEKNVIYQNENDFLNGKYFLFVDENLYSGVDLNHEIIVYDKCPCTCHGAGGDQQSKNMYTNRFSINVMENISEIDLTPYWIM